MFSSSRPLLPDRGENFLRDAEACPAKRGECGVELHKPGMIGFIKNGKRARDLQSLAKRFLPPRLFVDEQGIGMHLRGERDCFRLSSIELWQDQRNFGANDLDPSGRICRPFSHRFRRQSMAQFRHHGRRNQNPPVEHRQNVICPMRMR